jgi:hypothetical protein
MTIRLIPSVAASVLVMCASASLVAQGRDGTFRGTDLTGANTESSRVFPLRAVTGVAHWNVEIDTLDWRPKWTVRLQLTAPDTGAIVIRWATAARPTPGTYGVKIVSTGVSHADPKFVTVTFSVREGNKAREYLIGDELDRVVVTRANTNGSVAGTVAFFATRYSDGPPPAPGLRDYVNRKETGSFEAVAGGSAPQPAMTARLQQSILSRALFGFTVTWSGAMNGDGSADSTRTPVKARAYLASRWSEALIVDSLATNAGDFYLRVRGKIIPVVCNMTPHDLGPHCTIPRR